MKFKLYQIHLTEAEHNKVNADGKYSVPKNLLRLDMGLSDADQVALANEAFEKDYFTHVSNITAEDMEDVYRIGNIGPEENIERIAPMYSVSVGDVVEDENGIRSVVSRVGFRAL